jgi:CDP-diglyceride synthetase
VTRLLTAAVIIGALLGVLYGPPLLFAIAGGGVLLLGWNEYAGLTAGLGVNIASAPGALIALAVAVAFVAGPAATAAGFGGLAWLALPMGAQIGTRYEPDGALWLLFLYAAVAVGDSAAYYGGSSFGRRKLAPSLSPNKTVEGSLCGLFGSAIAGAAVVHWLPGTEYVAGAIAGAALGAVGQAGDLLESALKRAAGKKDSSALLPGHGGILDRVDAHLPAGAVLYAALRAGWLG